MATASYRIVHYVPDPTSAATFPVAAVVDLNGKSDVVLSPHIPKDACLGGIGRSRFLHRLQQRLDRCSGGSVPKTFGPYCVVSEASELPAGAGLSFVAKLVEDWHAALPSHEASPRISRDADSRRWLETHRVAPLVKSHFQPGHEHGSFLGHAPALERVTQFVPGTKSLCLMEPLVMRPRVGDDIRKVAQRFGAYATALASQAEGPRTKMIAYALPGVPAAIVDDARLAISYSGADVIDASDVLQRLAFIDRIKSVALETMLSLG